MHIPTAWMKRHALGTFFGLAYAFSWTVWLLQPVVERWDLLAGRIVDLLGPYGPSVAAITVAALLRPQRVPPNRSAGRALAAAVVLVIAVLVTRPLLGALPGSHHPIVVVLLWIVLVAVPALLVWHARSSVTGVRAVLHSLLAWRVHPVWYAAALGMFVLASIAGIGVLWLVGQPVPAWPRTEPLRELLPLLATTFAATLLYGGPLGEEAGWRGFALPRLQARFSPLVSSLILGVVWGLWHVPLHLRGFYQGVLPDGGAGIALRLFTSVGLAIVFTWLYNRTHGNLLLMVLLHTAANNTFGFWLPVTWAMYVLTGVLVYLVVSRDKMWLPPATPHPALHRGATEQAGTAALHGPPQ